MKKKELSKKVSLSFKKSTVVNLNPEQMQQVRGAGASGLPCGTHAITLEVYRMVTPIFWC